MSFLGNFFTNFTKGKIEDQDATEEKIESFAPVNVEDSIVVDSGGVVSHALMYGKDANSESDLIDRWREMATRAEVDWALQEVVNDAVVTDFESFPVDISLDGVKGMSESIKNKVTDEFNEVLGLLNFKRNAPEVFRQWFIDGKHYYHMILDPKDNKKGIIALRWIDPKGMKKVVEVEKTKSDNGVEIEKIKSTYFVYSQYANPKKFNSMVRSASAIKVDPNVICYSNSGLFRETPDGSLIAISCLDKAFRAANQLRLLEDAIIIYRLSRAPERRVFYIDVGNLPKTKAEQYLTSVMSKFRNKMVYDPSTGSVKDQRNNLSMVEDYWLPRREGGRGTEVTTLQGGQNLSQLEDLEYFYKQLYRTLNIPSTRLSAETTFGFGRGAEITREEVKFSKFIAQQRNRFNETFIQLLRTQLAAKNIMSFDEFEEVASEISFKWKTDNYWDEMMFSEMWQNRLNMLAQVAPYVGTYFSQEWVKENILGLSEDERKAMAAQIKKEPKPVQDDQ